jgi:hypothetical protein
MAVRHLLGRGTPRHLVSRLIRNKRMFMRPPRAGDYLDVGCGLNVRAGFCNLDYDWRPGVDICCDITRGLPVADGVIAGLFTEHCVEHIAFRSFLFVAAEFYRVLRPGAIVRIAVPDGALYLRNYCDRAALPYAEEDALDGLYTPIMSVNRIFRAHGHLFIYDFETLAAILARVGFKDVRRCSFGTGADPKLLIDTPARAVESLYVEARK